MTLHIVAAFWAVSFLFIITPGADWAYAISAGMRERRVAPAVAGLLSGHVLATLIVAAGVGAGQQPDGHVAAHTGGRPVFALAGGGHDSPALNPGGRTSRGRRFMVSLGLERHLRQRHEPQGALVVSGPFAAIH